MDTEELKKAYDAILIATTLMSFYSRTSDEDIPQPLAVALEDLVVGALERVGAVYSESKGVEL
jgi:hypothetical protein